MSDTRRSRRSEEEELHAELSRVRAERDEARMVIEAIRSGAADAVVVDAGSAPTLFTLADADRPYRLLFEAMHEGVLVVGSDGGVLSCNPRMCELCALPAERLVGAEAADLFGAESQARLAELLGRRGRAQLALSAADGREVPVTVTSSVLDLDGDSASVLLVTDITEEQAALSRVRFQARLLDTAADAISATDREGRFIYFNRAAERLYGWDREEVLGSVGVDTLIVPPDKETALAARQRLLAGEAWSGELVAHRKDGHVFPIAINSVPVLDETGMVSHLIAVTRDVTQEKRAAEALAASGRRFEALVHSSGDIFLLIDRRGRVTFVAGPTAELLGIAHDEVEGSNILDLLPAANRDHAVAQYRQLLEGAAIPTEEYWLQHVHGERVCLSAVAMNLLDDPDVRSIMVTARDVTRLKHLEEASRALSQVNSALVWATSEEQMLEDVCRSIVVETSYDFAWVSTCAEATPLGCRLMASSGLDGLDPSLLVAAGTTAPARPTAHEGPRVEVIDDLASRASGEAWHHVAAGTGYGSAAVLRFGVEGDEHDWLLGILAVETHGFPGPVVDVLVELVDDLAFGITAHRARLARDELRSRVTGLVEAVPAGIVAVRDDGVVTYANQEAEMLFGTDPGELVGTDLAAMVRDQVEWQPLGEIMGRASQGEPASGELELAGSDAGVRTIEVRTVAMGGAGASGETLVVLEDVTRQRADAAQLRFQGQLLEAAGEAVVGTRPDGTITYWNARAEALFGWGSETVLGSSIASIPFGPDLLARANELMTSVAAHESWSGELAMHRADGSALPTLVNISAVRRDGEVVGYIGVAVDITDRVDAERQAHRRARQHEEVAALGELALSDQPALVVLRAALERACQALEVPVAELFLEDEHGDLRLVAAIGVEESLVGELILPRHEGSLAAYTLDTRAPAIWNDLGDTSVAAAPDFLRDHHVTSGITAPVLTRHAADGVIGVFTDRQRVFNTDDVHVMQSIVNVTAHRLDRDVVERDLRTMAITDRLTGLVNRTLLSDRLELAAKRRARDGTGYAVLFADLDGFKDVNDALGHAAGDALLTKVAERIRSTVRAADTVARFGGDEFVVLCEQCSIDEAYALAERVRRAVGQEPIQVNEHAIVPTVSIGIAYSRDGSQNGDELIRDADGAMYQAKNAGRNRVAVFDAEMHDLLLRRLDLVTALRAATPAGQLELHYQPEIELSRGDLVWTEALVRWNHPVLGLLPPSEFIPIAEESGLIVPIGEWVLDAAIEQMSRWQALGPGRAPSAVSFNVSAPQLTQDLVSNIQKSLERHAVTPGAVWMELTETAILRDPERSLRVLHEIKDLGLGLAIDDFGTGYSSLDYFRKLPVDALKIDRTFVEGLGNDPRSEGIVRAIIELARSFDLMAIAEGVEHEEQYDRLRRLGCHFAQGYWFSRPGPPDETARWTAAYHDRRRT